MPFKLGFRLKLYLILQQNFICSKQNVELQSFGLRMHPFMCPDLNNKQIGVTLLVCKKPRTCSF